MKVAKSKVRHPKWTTEIHFPLLCLSKLSMLIPMTRETDVGSFRPLFAIHTNLWVHLSHWRCLLHRSLFRDKPRLKKGQEHIHKTPTRHLSVGNIRVETDWTSPISVEASQWEAWRSVTFWTHPQHDLIWFLSFLFFFSHNHRVSL